LPSPRCPCCPSGPGGPGGPGGPCGPGFCCTSPAYTIALAMRSWTCASVKVGGDMVIGVLVGISEGDSDGTLEGASDVGAVEDRLLSRSSCAVRKVSRTLRSVGIAFRGKPIGLAGEVTS
jgi:hypothetical protein